MSIQIKELPEGGSINLDSQYIEIAREAKSKNPSLPFRIDSNNISFDDYIVGELLLKDISIKLIPRNKAFTLNTYFQIICFLYDMESYSEVGTGFTNSDQAFNFKNLSTSFCDVCKKLIQFGLTGDYKVVEEYSHQLVGEINFLDFRTQTLPYKGLPVINNDFTVDTKPNQLIKAALTKLCFIDKYDINLEKFQILRDLNLVSDVSFLRAEAQDIIERCNSSNPWYLNAIDLSIRILFDLDLEYTNGEIEWLAYLENTNTLFEAYVRKALNENLDENILKWENPKTFMYMKSSTQTGKKEFSPDILVNYNSRNNTADAVIDVKNKSFEPTESSNLDSVVSTSDLYQLIVYCNQLNTKVGGLVFPSAEENEPIELMFDSQNGLKLFLFSINMNDHIVKRNKKLAEEIYKKLLREI